eukprot:Seg2592.3 transcript_id=Seg2592.3/GoldUCD/mRNA.D3Y31 product="HMG box-containing protein 4" protein_id=Seg2592.3/GoldUCD/D3Y31
MDDKRKKKKGFDFAEGHKRETRKSYQSFIEEATHAKQGTPFEEESQQQNWPSKSNTFSLDKVKVEDMSEERVRKSSRTPVPKKTFDLVDTYDESPARYLQSSSQAQRVMEEEEPHPQLIEVQNIKQEPSDTDSDSAPRKSGRTPVPKKNFNLIDSGYKAAPQQEKPDNIETQLVKKHSKTKNQYPDTPIGKSQARKPQGSAKKSTTKKDSQGSQSESSEEISVQQKGMKKASSEKATSHSKEKQPLKVKVDFKSKKEKSARKRKLDENVTSDSYSELDKSADEASREKIPKVVDESIEQSVLLEALQALKQSAQEDATIQAQGTAETDQQQREAAVPEKKGRKSRSKKTPTKLRRAPANVQQDAFLGGNIRVKVEDDQGIHGFGENMMQTEADKQGRDCSSSITERSDGHIILKVGGLNSPTKVKKHKKKHKHHHHHIHDKDQLQIKEEETYEHQAVEGQDLGIIVEEEENRFLFMQDSFDQSGFLSPRETMMDQSLRRIDDAGTDGDKKHKSHKRKRKMSQNRSFEELPTNNDGLVIKKRKIYKKKKGEKILVRIQTEFWNKYGELVKVEPAEIKEVANQDKVKTKKTNKGGKSKSAGKDMASSVTSKFDSSWKHDANTEAGATKAQGKTQAAKPKPKQRRKPVSSSATQVKATTKRSRPKSKAKQGREGSLLDSPTKKKKERKTQTLTAYLLYCRKHRPSVVAENPKISFSEISRKLAQMWNEAPEKEKEIYKKQLEEHRAKVNAVKRKETSKKLKTTKQSGQPSPVKKAENAQQKSSRVSSKEYQIAPQKYNVNNLDPVDMGAHLMLLGDSLTLVATALRRQVINRVMTQQADDLKVYGSLSVLLDSSLCAMAPLMFLTSYIPQLDVIPAQTKANILDNVAYILPGL